MLNRGTSVNCSEKSFSDLIRYKTAPLTEKLDDLNVPYGLDDGLGDAVSAPDTWTFAENDEFCGEGSRVLEFIAFGPEKPGRHYWSFNRLIQLEAFHRAGCITERRYKEALALIESMFNDMFLESSPFYDKRPFDPSQFANDHRDAIKKVALKNESGMLRELHHNPALTHGVPKSTAVDDMLARWQEKGGREEHKGGREEGRKGGTNDAAHILARHTLPPEFWKSRPLLTHIWLSAKARLVSPEAALAGVLTFASSAVGPHVLIPSLPSRDGSLNLFVGIVGEASVGKGSALEAAQTCLNIEGKAPVFGIGTGEGILKTFKTAHKDKDGNLTYKRSHISATFDIAEIATYEQLTGRSGATLIPQLTKAYSGEHLGFANADDLRRIPLEAHSYRLNLIMGVQPAKADVLFKDEAVGLPHRFLFATAYDIDASIDFIGQLPKSVSWVPPDDTMVEDYTEGRPVIYLEYPIEVSKEVISRRLTTVNGTANHSEMDGHDMLTRVKVTGILALLDGRVTVNMDDWSLSGAILEHSKHVRSTLVNMSRARKEAAVEYAGQMDVRRADAQSNARAQTLAKRLARAVHNHTHDNGHCTRKCLRSQVGGKGSDRYAAFDEALEIAERVGWIMSVPVVGSSRGGMHYKAGATSPS